MANIITANHIVKRYSKHTALNDVNINVPEGSIYGLLGPNGAGKTSLIRIINQITAPDEGEVLFFNEKMTLGHTSKIGYLPEERGLYKKMKVGEQALYLAQLKGLNKADALNKLRDWFKKFEIINWWDKKVEELSKGMAQKVQFIVTVLHEPSLLILDEPFSGFDPINVELIRNELLRLKNTGSTIILSTHNMASVEELCDHITLINHSKAVLEGSVHDIRQNYKEHLWELQFTGKEDSFTSAIENKFFPQQIETKKGVHLIRIKIPSEFSPNDLLKTVLPVCEVHGFTEILPSMSEIFIKAVKG
ncbi:MAG: ABC transporter ATP-binding protein [Bacteroidia bacterium]|nr:ABC transporter ATP-binding protein [Bacteroidia bacterium]